MPIVDGKYVAPTWVNKGAPPISASELQAMSDTLVANQTAVSTAQEAADDAQTTADGKYTKPSAGIPKSDLASDVQAALTGNAKIASGTYTGTGTYGADNPNSLTFSFEPKIVIMLGYLNSNGAWNPMLGYIPISSNNYEVITVMTASALSTAYSHYTGFLRGNMYSTTGTSWGKKSEDGKTFYWYDSGGAAGQCNSEGYTYFYLAIG